MHEVPLLYEAGFADRYDRVVLITAPDELRRARAPDALRRACRQAVARGRKVAQADHVYVNDGTPAELERWVAELVARLRAA